MLVSVYLFTALALAGLYISAILVVMHLNRRSIKWCMVRRRISCDLIFGSYSTLFKRPLTDISLLYFIAQSIFILLSSANNFNKSALSFLAIPSLFAVLFTVRTTAIQVFILKKYCSLCLSLTLVIWLQAILIISCVSFNEILFNLLNKTAIYNSAICLLIASSWFAIRPYLLNAAELISKSEQIEKWKADAGLFLAVLHSQKRIASDYWVNDYILGNPVANIRLIIVMNPFCSSCDNEYQEVLKLLHKYGSHILIIIRFSYSNEQTGAKPVAVACILSAYAATLPADKHLVLKDWFTIQDVDNFRLKYGRPYTDYKALAEKNQQWCNENGIEHTPTLFFNGAWVPRLYSPADLIKLLPGLLKFQKTASNRT